MEGLSVGDADSVIESVSRSYGPSFPIVLDSCASLLWGADVGL